MKPGGDQSDFDLAIFQGHQEIFQTFDWLESISPSGTVQHGLHLCVGNVKIMRSGLFDTLIRAIFVDAMLQVLADTVTGNIREIRIFQGKLWIIQQPGRRLFNNPYPEFLAANTGAVQIHQDGLNGFFDPCRLQRIHRRIAHLRVYIGYDAAIVKADKFRFFVAGNINITDAVFADFKLTLPADG